MYMYLFEYRAHITFIPNQKSVNSIEIIKIFLQIRAAPLYNLLYSYSSPNYCHLSKQGTLCLDRN